MVSGVCAFDLELQRPRRLRTQEEDGCESRKIGRLSKGGGCSTRRFQAQDFQLLGVYVVGLIRRETIVQEVLDWTIELSLFLVNLSKNSRLASFAHQVIDLNIGLLGGQVIVARRQIFAPKHPNVVLAPSLLLLGGNVAGLSMVRMFGRFEPAIVGHGRGGPPGRQLGDPGHHLLVHSPLQLVGTQVVGDGSFFGFWLLHACLVLRERGVGTIAGFARCAGL